VALLPLVAERQQRSLRVGIIALTLLMVFGTAIATRTLAPRIIVAPETLLVLRRVNLAGAVLFTAAILLVYRRFPDRAELRIAAARPPARAGDGDA